MERRDAILKHVTKLQQGIEVGPWFSPLAPKREGFNCLVLDVFDTETLRETARRDPNVPDDRIEFIEPVDIIGTSTNIESVIAERNQLGTFDYVISSHNFEHLPNPIKFLQGCGSVLKENGYLSMAIPDRRTCFDYFRPHTTLGAWIEAFLEDRNRPTFAQVFEQNSLHSRYKIGSEELTGFSLNDDPEQVVALQTLREAYETWISRKKSNDSNYYDAHCWLFTPSVFHQLISDTEFLGLSPFSVEEVSESNGNEFYVHLKNTGYKIYSTEETRAHYEKRQRLLHNIECESGYHSITSFKMRSELTHKTRDDISHGSIFTRLGVASGDIEAAHTQIDNLHHQLDQTQNRINELSKLIEHERHAHIQHLNDLDRFISEQRAHIADLHQSTSWKITAPLRRIKLALRRLTI
ncbi:class I SAM-dependent methyltransferase [Burkholderia multivorans]|uniref:class I SAM-dependent methyltransferase n=1 Tax=Burkholderia multivorans TaxID=87883 RepID=UPI000CFF643F|nr:methyltransferase domain-containing protein [Burkholderia multivorans]MCO8588147.1 methyltransferase domain-containing protein [Burkholderia multivorans]MCO8630667.1 methyltransferase domain-containing protein [Burkholderia multivorans]MCO8647008.1 methyltransferase domain-containing protein [Burkholderia multivorans]MDN7864153.1 methyltransferase domain-containing protein [Burkholderia multivorans]